VEFVQDNGLPVGGHGVDGTAGEHFRSLPWTTCPSPTTGFYNIALSGDLAVIDA
jgi:hypothetical protein